MKWKMSSQRQCGWGFIYDNIPIYQCSEPQDKNQRRCQ